MNADPTPRTPAAAASGSVVPLPAPELAACTGNSDDEDDAGAASVDRRTASGGNDEPGKTVTIGFAAPAADHGWIAAITTTPRPGRPVRRHHPACRRGQQRRQPSVTQMRDVHQRRSRRDRDPALRRRAAHRRPLSRRWMRASRSSTWTAILRQPAGRPHDDPRRQLRHGRLGRQLRLPAGRGDVPTR